tara:strand:- start:5790 stop:7502 length:1713 start_codon:yes stop_codon:yes gene_type:complete
MKLLEGPLRLAVVGAAGSIGTHISSLWINGIRAYLQSKHILRPDSLTGQYSDALIDLPMLEQALTGALKKFTLGENQLPIQLDLILNKPTNAMPVSTGGNSSKFLFADGFGFHPVAVDEQANQNRRVQVPKSDLDKLGVRIIDNLELCCRQEEKYHLLVIVVKEGALLCSSFCRQLSNIVHSEGQIALSMNGLPPYFLDLFSDPIIRNCNLMTNHTKEKDNIVQLLGGPEKLIGVVLTVADRIEQKTLVQGTFHISQSAKKLVACKLGSRQVIPGQQAFDALPSDFFQSFGIAVGLGTKIEQFLDQAIVQKLAVNFVLNPISALHPTQIKQLLNDELVKNLIMVINDQFVYMATTVMGFSSDILYPRDHLIERLALSAEHVPSSAQDVQANRQIEYFNLMAFLDLVLQVAKKRNMLMVKHQVGITTELFGLFQTMYVHLQAYSKDSTYPLAQHRRKLSQNFVSLLNEAKKIAVTPRPGITYASENRGLIFSHLFTNKIAAANEFNVAVTSAMTVLKKYKSLEALVRQHNDLYQVPESVRECLKDAEDELGRMQVMLTEFRQSQGLLKAKL